MSVRPDVGLERLIHGLEQELLEAADEEFMAGAHDLGMNPESLLSALRRAYQERLDRTPRDDADA
jgi:hypothetical protein